MHDGKHAMRSTVYRGREGTRNLRADGSLPLGPIFDRRVEMDYVPSGLNRAQIVSKNLQYRGKVNGQSTLSRHLTERHYTSALGNLSPVTSHVHG